MKTISIIILSKTTNQVSANLLFDTLSSLEQCKDNHKIKEVIIVENSNEELEFKSNLNIKVLNKTSEFNYNGFANEGIKSLTDYVDYICVANNDLKFDKNWLSILNYDYNSMSPKCSLTKSQEEFKVNTMGYRIAKELAGWCIILKKDVWEIIKGFDESVSFWCSDDIYAQQLIENEIEHWVIPESRVDHIGVGSNTLKTLSKEEKDKLTIEQVKIFNKKYNKNLFNLKDK